MSTPDALQEHAENSLDTSVAEGGAYDVIRKRLDVQSRELLTQTETLNESRLNEFGRSDMSVMSRIRVRTEHNCIARDMVQVGSNLLFGYNVFIGLKKETQVQDVFALFEPVYSDDDYALEPLNLDDTFLNDSRFTQDFEELYRYYKNTKLVELTVKQGKLLAGFQIGERLTDLRVFRWSISACENIIDYIDNRGERDIQLPPAFDFEWQETRREDAVHGRHSHINILDTVFVETINGDLTLKIENNTEDGLGIYQELVDDQTQSLDDGDFHYAEVGKLILLKIRPYREEKWRYFIFNTLTQSVLRIDALGESCVQLPEDHGLIFPGGYYLQSGEYKTFDENTEGFTFKRAIRSPNGEDISYVFYNPNDGAMGLFAYNLIDKQLGNPIMGHGYALAEDGILAIFTAEEEATRIHPMQIWQTPFISADFAAQQPTSQSFLGKIGNAALVRGVSDLFSITRMIDDNIVSQKRYEALSSTAKKIFDNHYWLTDASLKLLADTLKAISDTAELVIDEFIKVQSIQTQSAAIMRQAETDQSALLKALQIEQWEQAEDYVNALIDCRQQRGRLMTIKGHRYIDLDRIEIMTTELNDSEAGLQQKTVDFLADERALAPYFEKISRLDSDIAAAENTHTLTPLVEAVKAIAEGLDLLSELMATLKVPDVTLKARIIEAISDVYAKLNQSKAQAKHREKALTSTESTAQFSAQFKLLSQSLTNALGNAATPDACDEQLSRLLVQLEDLESQFSGQDTFLADILTKREDIYEAFESHKQQLIDEQQRKAQSLTDAAQRMLKNMERRSLKMNEAQALHTYFSSDALVIKVRDLIEQLRALDSNVKADEIASGFAAIKEQALRALRDKTDIYEEGGNVIKLGPRHKFSVNTQPLDLTIIPREGDLYCHITGTQYFEKIDHPELLALKDYWSMNQISETDQVYRAEFLAYEILDAAQHHKDDLTLEKLDAARLDEAALTALVRDFAAPRYQEGYQKGIHDEDAKKILQALLPALAHADLLRFSPLIRAVAQVFWLAACQGKTDITTQNFLQRAQSAQQMKDHFGSLEAINLFTAEVSTQLTLFATSHALPVDEGTLHQAADYLAHELGRPNCAFIQSQQGLRLIDSLKTALTDDLWKTLRQALSHLNDQVGEQWQLATAWLTALLSDQPQEGLAHYIPEACAILLSESQLSYRRNDAVIDSTITGLMGSHARIKDRSLRLSLDEFLQRLAQHKTVIIPAYQRYLAVRKNIISEEREKLRLHEFTPKPLSSFVRNRLINEAYLPIIGDNLAKQMGALGDKKRTDLMGLLMMISPPGYGKTTLMEYVASRLGLIFMKINCPSLGHEVVSLDPATAPNSTAAQELIKLNLALEMGDNVMLYLDDIQHTDPEFLQKFISLCDGTRRIEGIWQGQTKTYDMRGRKFCVVMAGNPYTESGDVFKVPDMLANRADIYNLGDVLGGMEEPFSLSYVENALTSHPVLAPLALREMQDIYHLIAMAQGKEVSTHALSHPYSGAELDEIVTVFKKLFVVQEVILNVNQQYIQSAAQDNQYRTEPAFKLQGSYRNMNKMTEKVSAVMNDDELLTLIADHYVGEAQLLTAGAEANLLKLAELRGNMTAEETERWKAIKADFLRNKAMGGDDADVGSKVVAQLVDLVSGFKQLNQTAEQVTQSSTDNSENNLRLHPDSIKALLSALDNSSSTPSLTMDRQSLALMAKIFAANKTDVQVVNQPVPGIQKVLHALAESIEYSLSPLVQSMDKKLDIDLKNHDKMIAIAEKLKNINIA